MCLRCVFAVSVEVVCMWRGLGWGGWGGGMFTVWLFTFWGGRITFYLCEWVFNVFVDGCVCCMDVYSCVFAVKVFIGGGGGGGEGCMLTMWMWGRQEEEFSVYNCCFSFQCMEGRTTLERGHSQ